MILNNIKYFNRSNFAHWSRLGKGDNAISFESLA